MHQALRQIERGLGILSGLFAVVGGIALAILTGVTVVSVFYRYGLRDPIFGVEDISTMILTVLVAASIAWAATQRGHVAVNVLPMFLGQGVSRLTDVLARGLSAGVLGVAAYALFKKGSCGMPCGALTSNLSIIHTPFYYVLGAAMALYAAIVLLHLLIGLLHWSGTDPNAAVD